MIVVQFGAPVHGRPDSRMIPRVDNLALFFGDVMQPNAVETLSFRVLPRCPATEQLLLVEIPSKIDH